jgi:hypothetical protein
MNLTKILIMLVASLTMSFTLTSNVFAGTKGTYNVSVSSTSFNGSLGSARNSADANQQIGCWSYSSGSGFCYGKDSTGTTASCSTSDAAMLTAIKSIKGDSYIRVNYSSGACTNVFVSNFSSFAPKAP